MSFMKSRTLSIALVLMGISSGYARAQGCVAAHSSQRTFDELISGSGQEFSQGSRWAHNLTIDIGYRVFNSNKYFQGSTEIPRPSAVRNHQNIFDVGAEYQLSPRLSVIADVPVFNGTRNQIYAPTGIFEVSGVGDITVGLQSWIFRPPTENGGNVAVNMQLKTPTGKDNATGAATLKGQTVIATADQSLQPGDGTWGFSVGTQAYKTLWHRATAYGQGNYLFSPADTNGVTTFRTQPGQGVMSATDQYLFRGGIVQGVPKVKRLVFSAGVRGEGVPVRDLLGASVHLMSSWVEPPSGGSLCFDPETSCRYRRYCWHHRGTETHL